MPSNLECVSAACPTIALTGAAGGCVHPRVGASQEAEFMGRLLRRPPARVCEPALGLRTHKLGRLSRTSEEEACTRKAARRRVVSRRRGAGALALDPGDSWWGLPSPWNDVSRDCAGMPPGPVSHGEALGTDRGRPRTPGASKRLLHGQRRLLRQERPASQPGSSPFRECGGRSSLSHASLLGGPFSRENVGPGNLCCSASWPPLPRSALRLLGETAPSSSNTQLPRPCRRQSQVPEGGGLSTPEGCPYASV